MLKVEHLSYGVREREIVKDVSISVESGEFVGIIGPNGSGKSTLLKNVYKVLTPKTGEITLMGQDLLRMSNREMAQKMSVVVQEQESSFDFTVEEVVMMGRLARKGLLSASDEADRLAVRDALALVGLEQLMDRSFLSLSGGEKQRVIIARTFAQDGALMVLDEPTNHLDVGSQIKILELLKNSGKTVLAALHDLALAAKYCSRIYVMLDGQIAAEGKPSEVITRELIRRLYDVDADLFYRNGNLCIDYCAAVRENV